jgi:hypothetical protein
MAKNRQIRKAKNIYTIEQRIRCRKISPYEITGIYNPPEDGP